MARPLPEGTWAELYQSYYLYSYRSCIRLRIKVMLRVAGLSTMPARWSFLAENTPLSGRLTVIAGPAMICTRQ
jgi:hypothetical protein